MEWISVKEKLPNKGQDVLVRKQEYFYVASHDLDNIHPDNLSNIVWTYSVCCGCNVTGITHWTELSPQDSQK